MLKKILYVLLILYLLSYTYERLMNKISSGNSLLFQSQIQHQLTRRFEIPPPTWAGFDVNFIVTETFKHFSAVPPAVKTQFKKENRRLGGGGPGVGIKQDIGNKRSLPITSSPGML